MKRAIGWLVVGGGALVGASVLAKRRKEQAWENEIRGEAEWPLLQMESPPEPAKAARVEPPTADEPAPETSGDWVESLPEGDCPGSHPVKAKHRSGIYHVEGNLAYERTNADRCYLSAEAAEADGFRAAKS